MPAFAYERTIAIMLGLLFVLFLALIGFYGKRMRSLSIATPPGSLILWMAKHIFSPRTSELVAQMVADMRFEYYEALAAGRPSRAFYLKFLHYVAIARALTVDRIVGVALNYFLGTIEGTRKK
jgi:hypothetical protein